MYQVVSTVYNQKEGWGGLQKFQKYAYKNPALFNFNKLIIWK